MKTCRHTNEQRSGFSVHFGFLLYLFFLSALFFSLSLPAFSADTTNTPGLDFDSRKIEELYILTFLLSEENSLLNKEIDRLHSMLDQHNSEARGNGEELSKTATSADAGDLKNDKIRYALAALLTYRYIREERREDAFRAMELLEKTKPAYESSYTHRVHLGMAHSFVAKIRTVFGVSNLESMEEYMSSIPEDYPNWLVRFLRGTTLVQVGSALPGIFKMREIKEKAIRIGSDDLEYVIEEYDSDPLESFDPSSYDPSSKPVPRPIAEQCRKIIRDTQ